MWVSDYCVTPTVQQTRSASIITDALCIYHPRRDGQTNAGFGLRVPDDEIMPDTVVKEQSIDPAGTLGHEAPALRVNHEVGYLAGVQAPGSKR